MSFSNVTLDKNLTEKELDCDRKRITMCFVGKICGCKKLVLISTFFNCMFELHIANNTHDAILYCRSQGNFKFNFCPIIIYYVH